MSTYSDYFAFDSKSYHPEINPESRKTARWQDTFPHKTFIDLLKRTERMLARGTNKDKHSIWIQGAYGTGKSRIAWTLSNILTCSVADLREYFDTYDDLRAEPDLLDRLIGHKSGGRIVVAERYKSDDINSPEDLVTAVYDALVKALDAVGCDYASAGTVKGGILKALEDADARTYFNSLIKRDPWRHEGAFAGKTADGIVAELKNGGDTNTNLVRGILKMSKREGFPRVRISADDLIEWIKDVIALNNLKELVLVWDEFSSFFKNNKTRLDSFQALVELQDSTPFNLVIVTHFSGSIFRDEREKSAANVVIDRFSPQTEIKMPESIAFKLIGHVLKVKSALADSWDIYAGDLNSRLDSARRSVATHLKGVTEADFKKMLPFHPYAAFVLKNIAELFDSNQRSMFNFIVDETEGLNAFQWFIKNKSPDDGDLLSVDELWDYFYETGRGAAGDVGRSNLDMQVRAILDVYADHESKLMSDDRRVLKTVLIFQALAKKLNNLAGFLATEENLRAAFEGIDTLENSRGVNLCKKLVKDGVLFVDEIGGKKVFQAPMRMGGRDGEEIEKQKELIRLQTRTRDLIAPPCSVETLLPLTPALKARYLMRLAAPENFKQVLGQLINEDGRNYRMKAMLLLARSSGDAEQIREQIEDATNNNPQAGSIVFIDASASTMREEEFKRWAEAKAKAQYYSSKDRQQSNNALNEADRILRAWHESVRDGSFRYHAPKDSSGMPCTRGEDVISALKVEVTRTFNTVLDFEPGLTEACFKAAGKSSVYAGVLGGRDNLPPRTSCVIGDKQEAVLLAGVKEVPFYWKRNPDLPLSKLKRKIDNLIARAFEPGSEGKIAIREIVDTVIKQGFMPTNLSAFLTGWLLKEYASGEYRYSSGGAGGVMNPDKLTEMIANYFSRLNGTSPRYTDEHIEMLTDEQRLFVEWSKDIFGLTEASSIELVASQIITRVKGFQYPLWCFDVLQEAVGVENFIAKYTALLNPANARGGNSGLLATEIGRLAKEAPSKKETLARLFTRENAERAMRQWLGEFENGELLRIAEEIHASDPLSDVRRCFDTEHVWLWDREKGEEEVRKVLRDYRIIAESIRRGFITAADSFPSCLVAWSDKAKTLRIPYATLVTVRKDLKDFLTLLHEIADGGRLEENFKRDRFHEEITVRGDLIREFFNGAADLFRQIYRTQLSALGVEEMIEFYNTLDTTSFLRDKATYEAALTQKAEDAARLEERGRLAALWKERTGTESPRDWSNRFGTPILLTVPVAVFDEAKEAFDAVNTKNTPSAQVRRAIEILERHPEILMAAGDGSEADEVFRRKALGRFGAVLKDLAAVRAKLRQFIGDEVYGWYGHPEFKRIVREMAQSEYNATCARKLGERIDRMTSDDAKAYLKRLVLDQFEIGIEILSEE